jgi:hypothetical protein
MSALTVESRHAELVPDTDPASVEPVLAAAVAARRGRLFAQFAEPLPGPLLSAVADALRQHPDVVLRAYGRELDPGLGWLSGFEHIRHLALDLWQATSFDPLAAFTSLRSLSLGDTKSTRPSLVFLRNLPQLAVLWLEAQARDFDAVADVPSLVRLGLRVTRLRSLDPLRGHPGVQVLTMDFGGIRDLSPLADLPRLRGLELYQVRGLDTDDLDALGDCAALEAVSLGALRNVTSLRALTRRPGQTLRLLNTEQLTGLASLAELAGCEKLEQLGLYKTRPADRRLDVLLQLPALRHLAIGDTYPDDQVQIMRDQFRGDTLWYRSERIRGDLSSTAVHWRERVHAYLGLPD